MPSTPLERQVEQRLAGSGVRFTKGRRRVLRALMTADGPRSASEIQESVAGAIPLSSLYRSLTVLEEAGVLERHHSARGITRYELAEWLAGHHHHLVCIDCGAVDDIHLPDELEATLERVVARVTDDASFAAAGHSLEIDGRCGRCA